MSDDRDLSVNESDMGDGVRETLGKLKLSDAAKKILGRVIGIPFGRAEGERAVVLAEYENKAAITRQVGARAQALIERDPSILNRAAIGLLDDALQRQSAKEDIVQRAGEALEREPPVSAAEADDIDEDWMNLFSQLASQATSERMRAIWAKVLAGEIRDTGSYSLSCLSFMAQLDKPRAEIIKRLSPFVVNDGFIVRSRAETEFLPLLRLEEFGLASGASSGVGGIQYTITIDKQGRSFAWSGGDGLLIVGQPGQVIKLDVIALSMLGSEVFSLIGERSDAGLTDLKNELVKSKKVQELRSAKCKFVSGDTYRTWDERVIWTADQVENNGTD